MLLILFASAGSCADGTITTRLRAPETSSKQLQFTDWYSCSRLESATEWNCEYTGSTSTYIASWADFPTPPQYTSLTERKMSNEACPTCPTDPGTSPGPHVYAPNFDAGDALQAGVKPDCRIKQTDIRNDAWCKAGAVLLPLRKARILDALNKMDALGGECSVLAAKGRSLLDGSLRVYDPGPAIAYTGAGFGDSGGFGLLSSRWTDEFIEPGSTSFTTVYNGVGVTVKAGLQYVLAHELDHIKGRYHIDGPNQQGGIGAITPNSIACGG